MKSPGVEHPIQYKVDEVIYQVVAYDILTERQAQKILSLHIEKNKHEELDKGQIVKVCCELNQEEIDQL